MDPDECNQMKEWSKICKHLIPTYGIHPWNSHRVKFEQMEPYLHECSVIGEIGMDSVWCKVPLDIQETIFRKQLDVAEKRQVPVILHTKGQEKQIAEIVSDYTMPLLVHWYSCDRYLEMYLKKDCYFTIGPDIGFKRIAEELAKAVPLNRLLIETDGVVSISWVTRKQARSEDVPPTLHRILDSIAKLRNISKEALRDQVNQNFREFLKKNHNNIY